MKFKNFNYMLTDYLNEIWLNESLKINGEIYSAKISDGDFEWELDIIKNNGCIITVFLPINLNLSFKWYEYSTVLELLSEYFDEQYAKEYDWNYEVINKNEKIN